MAPECPNSASLWRTGRESSSPTASIPPQRNPCSTWNSRPSDAPRCIRNRCEVPHPRSPSPITVPRDGPSTASAVLSAGDRMQNSRLRIHVGPAALAASRRSHHSLHQPIVGPLPARQLERLPCGSCVAHSSRLNPTRNGLGTAHHGLPGPTPSCRDTTDRAPASTSREKRHPQKHLVVHRACGHLGGVPATTESRTTGRVPLRPADPTHPRRADGASRPITRPCRTPSARTRGSSVTLNYGDVTSSKTFRVDRIDGRQNPRQG